MSVQPVIIGNATLYCGNCLELLPAMRNKPLVQAETTVPLQFVPVCPK